MPHARVTHSSWPPSLRARRMADGRSVLRTPIPASLFYTTRQPTPVPRFRSKNQHSPFEKYPETATTATTATSLSISSNAGPLASIFPDADPLEPSFGGREELPSGYHASSDGLTSGFVPSEEPFPALLMQQPEQPGTSLIVFAFEILIFRCAL